MESSDGRACASMFVFVSGQGLWLEDGLLAFMLRMLHVGHFDWSTSG